MNDTVCTRNGRAGPKCLFNFLSNQERFSKLSNLLLCECQFRFENNTTTTVSFSFLFFFFPFFPLLCQLFPFCRRRKTISLGTICGQFTFLVPRFSPDHLPTQRKKDFKSESQRRKGFFSFALSFFLTLHLSFFRSLFHFLLSALVSIFL